MIGEHLQWLNTAWMADAACAGVSRSEGYSVFFPNQSSKVRTTIKEYCDRCPVKIECDEYATRLGISSGIWGGRSRSA